jgi:hypothetical protein
LAALQQRNAGDDTQTILIERADRIALSLRTHNQQEFRSKLPLDESYSEEDVICFWMTNVLDLMGVVETDVGEELRLCQDIPDANGETNGNLPKRNRYKLQRKPLKLPDYNVLCRVLNAREDALNDTYDDGEADSLESSDEETSSSEESSSTEDTTAMNGASYYAWEQIMSSAYPQTNNTIQEEPDHHVPLHQCQIALTFRSNLPEDVPPTITAECVKYFYSAVLIVTTTDGEVIITDCPFAVLTRNSSNTITLPQSSHSSSTRVHIGELYAMAHSSFLPCKLSPIEALGDKQLHVLANPPACSIVSRMSAERRTSTHRIHNENGSLCAWLTLVGVGGPIAPGTRLGMIVRFPTVADDDVGESGIVPCHRVCCALVGEEYALCEGAALPASSGMPPTKRKTRSYVFDSTYELVEFGYTNSISMGLLLPSDCPVTVKTDLVEVVASLKLEFTVDRIATEQVVESNEAASGFETIRLELPVEIVHDEELANEEEEEANAAQSQLASICRFWNAGKATNSTVAFDETDIHEDLKTLSLRLLE